ncbi:MAG: DinB family protein [Methanoregulaceae archaeon]|nr:DinB family protein [Methanoregulaceae archaeon]
MRYYILHGLEATPGIFRKLVQLLRADQIDVPAGEDRFTPREIIAHLADWESILRDERMARAVKEPGCTIQPYDEVLRAKERRYASLDVEQQLAHFELERRRTIEFLNGLTPTQQAATFVHPEAGQFTVAEFSCALLGHDVYHIEQLTNVVRRD